MPDDLFEDEFGPQDAQGGEVITPEEDEFEDWVLDISDEALDDASKQAADYPAIPRLTRLDCMIYTAEMDVFPGSPKINRCPKWVIIAQALTDEWGPGRRFKFDILFAKEYTFMWLPFLNAIGVATASGQVKLPPVTDILGLKFNAQVVSHRWVDPNTQKWHSTHSGRKEDRKQIPAGYDGPRFEELDRFKAVEGDTGAAETPQDSGSKLEEWADNLFE